MLNTFGRYYNGKRVLVTGHTGFKGSWLCIWLRELGADVLGFSLEPPSDPNNFTVCKLESKIGHTIGDVRDFDLLKKTFEEYKPDIVFHLAAQALVRKSYELPKPTMETNVLGTLNILEVVRSSSFIGSIIIVTSDKCYENREQLWGYKENDPMGGDDPYSASKGAAELVFRGYLRSFFQHRNSMGAATVRAGNVIGGGDWGKYRIVPDCVAALYQKKLVEVRNPTSIRPWQFVLEPLSGYLWLGVRLNENSKQFSSGWNFSPADTGAKSVRDLVEGIISEWGSGGWVDISHDNDHNLHETNWLRLSSDKARHSLPWSAILTFEENIQMTTKWYKYFYDYRNTNMYQFCVHQIREYTELARKRNQEWTV